MGIESVGINPLIESSTAASSDTNRLVAQAVEKSKIQFINFTNLTRIDVDETRPEVLAEGKRQLLRVLRESRYETNSICRGVFYWEPECRPSQYRLGAFTEDGHPTLIMEAFSEMR